MASVSDNPSRFFIGSAGLTHAFASLLPVGNRKRTIFQPSEGGNLIIVGSLAYASRSAAEELIASRDIGYFPISPDILLQGVAVLEQFARSVGVTLWEGHDAVVVISVDDAPDVKLPLCLRGPGVKSCVFCVLCRRFGYNTW